MGNYENHEDKIENAIYDRYNYAMLHFYHHRLTIAYGNSTSIHMDYETNGNKCIYIYICMYIEFMYGWLTRNICLQMVKSLKQRESNVAIA